jgi:hypothetical protein
MTGRGERHWVRAQPHLSKIKSPDSGRFRLRD